MKIRLRGWAGVAAASVLALSSAAVNALGLGPIEVRSHLNEPFDARIPIIGGAAAGDGPVSVFLAEPQRFRAAGLARPFVLATLQFEVVGGEQGPQYVQVSSRQPLREPVLDFLVELSAPSARLVQRYTVLLDPAPAAGSATASTAATPARAEQAAASATSAPASPAAAAPAPATGDTGERGVYGPVVPGETLWSIAARLRPNPSVSVQQMMLALLRENPQAFSADNVGALRAGALLRIPPPHAVTAISPAEAQAEVRRHYGE